VLGVSFDVLVSYAMSTAHRFNDEKKGLKARNLWKGPKDILCGGKTATYSREF
jgi:hypothetical protein